MKNISILVFSLAVSIAFLNSASADMVTFEGLLPSSNTTYNGGPTTNANGFTIGETYFPNSYSSLFGAWDGWSYSNVVDTTQKSYLNQYAAWPGSGAGGSSSYGVAYVFEPTYISFSTQVMVASADFANTTWTALTMLNGDTYSKKFGGDSGNDPDYLLLTIEGRTGSEGLGNSTGSIDFYLGDYRSADNALDFVRSGWTNLDLSGLGAVQSLRFSMSSTDVGAFGINTPTYFAIDNLSFISTNASAIPEPNSLLLIVVSTIALSKSRRRV